MYSHILVAIDFSASTDVVLAKASAIAQRNNAKLTLLHVIEYLPPLDAFGEPYFNSDFDVDESMLLERSKQSLQNISDKNKLQDAELSVQLGTPKHEISYFVKENDCDLVVMGSHGRHGISLLLGSTANAVLHDMPCDILTVRLEK